MCGPVRRGGNRARRGRDVALAGPAAERGGERIDERPQLGRARARLREDGEQSEVGRRRLRDTGSARIAASACRCARCRPAPRRALRRRRRDRRTGPCRLGPDPAPVEAPTHPAISARRSRVPLMRRASPRRPAPARRGRRGQPRPQPSSRDRGCTGGWLRGRSPKGATAATLDACASRSATVRRPRPKPATPRAGRRPAWRRGTRSPQPPENPVRLETCREPDLAPVKAASGWWLRAPSPEPGRVAIGRGARGQRSRTAPQAAR